MAIIHTIRKDGNNQTITLNLTPRTAILRFCSECMGFNQYEVEKCTSPLCPLFPFRNRRATKGTQPRSELQRKHDKLSAQRLQKSTQIKNE